MLSVEGARAPLDGGHLQMTFVIEAEHEASCRVQRVEREALARDAPKRRVPQRASDHLGSHAHSVPHDAGAAT